MSSIEHAYEKVSNINIYNFERPGQPKADDKGKIDIDALQKSLSNIHIPSHENILNEFQEMQMQTAPECVSKIRILIDRLTPHQFIEEREDYSLYIFPENNR